MRGISIRSFEARGLLCSPFPRQGVRWALNGKMLSQLLDFPYALTLAHCAARAAGIDFAHCSPKAPCGPRDRPPA